MHLLRGGNFVLLKSKYLPDYGVIGKIENVTQRSSRASAEGNDKILINWKSPNDQEVGVLYQSQR